MIENPLLSFLSENSWHTPHDPFNTSSSLFQSPGLFDELQQFMEDQEHAMVRFRRRDLKEAAVGRQGKQSPFFTWHGSLVLKVPLVSYNDDGHRCGELPHLADELHLLAHHLKAGAVTDAVDEDDPVSPLQLLLTNRFGCLTALKKERHSRSQTMDILPRSQHCEPPHTHIIILLGDRGLTCGYKESQMLKEISRPSILSIWL